MIDFHEIRIDFNKRGDPDYASKDLNINQYSKNADKLSFNFEEESFQSVVFSAKRNDGEESPKIAMTLNPDSHRYEYVFGQDEESNTSTSSWFSYIMGKLLITVYLVNEEQYIPMRTFSIFVNPSIFGGGDSVIIPPNLADIIYAELNKKLDKENDTATGLTLNNSFATAPTTPKSVATKEYVDSEIQTKSGNYENLTNKPKINGVELIKDKSFEDLGMSALDKVEILSILT